MAITLMVQGTTSDAGKSTLVCGLARAFKRQGLNVAPFKPQNMALNSAVTIDGGEIGRAQALQAQACGLEPITDFNPVLLKPSTDIGCQVIINGKVAAQLSAVNYHNYKPTAMKAVLAAHQRLEQGFDMVVVEGAGSPAEINLRDRDIANMGFAEEVDCPVIIVADIDRGGVFAHLTGTLACLSQSEQDRVIGFVINRFRGDRSLLTSGNDWLEEQTGKPVLAVLPYLQGLYLDSEDSVATEQHSENPKLKVVVPVYPRISNHNDLDAMRAHPQLDVELIGPQLQSNTEQGQASTLNQPKPAADLIVLMGSKNTQADLQWLKEQGWDSHIAKHLRYGGKILAICGGLQMLGQLIDDPDAIESPAAKRSQGFGYLPINTVLTKDKELTLKQGQLRLPGQEAVAIQGYEIHAGVSLITELQPITQVVFEENDVTTKEHAFGAGCLSSDGQIFASYWHGLMDTPEALNAILTWAGDGESFDSIDYQVLREQSIDALADSVEQEFDWTRYQQAMNKFNQQR
ncbi:cobyric acid synthase [Psychrobium sp. 1_MG-2023]|uniref:cobyric acid synthase n=1 Tax=Psychrobium sp. 1_MG-2023 TaxID=3062624 RepID=UPI000C339824|nr:cobyric acid synthase [Psychrobium sp. 1_MG-2023]MDP2560079.1 cobyric acid synthase [Psychrobium sp. 1_MG-2023]PKF56262.1 cobyric acid synthase CobQ [Alteromonadales bacterium alter-6D02]